MSRCGRLGPTGPNTGTSSPIMNATSPLPPLQRLSRLYYQVVTPPAPRRSFQPRLPTQCLSYLSSELSTSLDRTRGMTMSVPPSPSRCACPLPLGFPRRSPTTHVLPKLPSPVRRPSWPLLELFHRHRTRGPEGIIQGMCTRTTTRSSTHSPVVTVSICEAIMISNDKNYEI